MAACQPQRRSADNFASEISRHQSHLLTSPARQLMQLTHVYTMHNL